MPYRAAHHPTLPDNISPSLNNFQPTGNVFDPSPAMFKVGTDSMPSEATAKAPDSAVNLDFYVLRDDFMRIYKPATEEQKLLVLQMVRAWQHLQEVYQLQAHLTAEKGLLGLFEEDYEKYKFLSRDLTAAERMWRNALHEFQRARRATHPSLRENLRNSSREVLKNSITEVRPVRVGGPGSPAISQITSNQITPITRRTPSEGLQPSTTSPVDQEPPNGPGGLQTKETAPRPPAGPA